MKAKKLLSLIPNKYRLNDIFSYFPEKLGKYRILNLFRYNKKWQKLFNIDLYTYQKEYLILSLKNVNPREYNIYNLHNYFKLKNTFNKENDKEILIKIIKELYPEEKEEKYDILKELNFKKIINFHKINNLTSIEIDKLPKNENDLKHINNPNIKKLKINDRSVIKMPFSLLNNLEALILGSCQINIYSIPNINEFLELKNLKYLHLKQTGVTKKLNIKFSSPNLIYLFLEIVAYYKKISYFAYYFDLYGEEEEEKEKEENEDNDSFSNSENYESYNSHIHDYNDILPQYDVDKYYDKYIYLKYLSLLIFDDSTSQEIFQKNIKCVKITNNIIKCYDYKNESSDFQFTIRE